MNLMMKELMIQLNES